MSFASGGAAVLRGSDSLLHRMVQQPDGLHTITEKVFGSLLPVIIVPMRSDFAAPFSILVHSACIFRPVTDTPSKRGENKCPAEAPPNRAPQSLLLCHFDQDHARVSGEASFWNLPVLRERAHGVHVQIVLVACHFSRAVGSRECRGSRKTIIVMVYRCTLGTELRHCL